MDALILWYHPGNLRMRKDEGRCSSGERERIKIRLGTGEGGEPVKIKINGHFACGTYVWQLHRSHLGCHL